MQRDMEKGQKGSQGFGGYMREGHQGRPFLGSKFFQCHAVFSIKRPNNSFSHPSLKWAPPPRENPGSATAKGIEKGAKEVEKYESLKRYVPISESL